MILDANSTPEQTSASHAPKIPAVSVSIQTIVFNDGTSVSLSPNDVVVIVGPNNGGKSAALRAIQLHLPHAKPTVIGQLHSSNTVIRSMTAIRKGTVDELQDWLAGQSVSPGTGPANRESFRILGQPNLLPAKPPSLGLGMIMREAGRPPSSPLQWSKVSTVWAKADTGIGELAPFFCRLLSAGERLEISNPAENIAITRDSPSHPNHVLLRNDELEQRLSAKFRKAFGVDLVLHRNAGTSLPLHVGDRPVPLEGEDRVSLSYVKRIEALPTLQSQGDGMRSFAGVLLVTSVGQESILLVDEPEAFLHPPQARLLGNSLVQERSGDRQLFVATHSADVLRGVLDTESPDIHVIRIQRRGQGNTVRLLRNDEIRQLWSDPLLRYSNILDGLFHEMVVLCEGDSDCRFYAAVLDAVLAIKKNTSRRPDLMFTHCGGKHRLPTAIRALREVGVPLRVVTDFDVLSEEEPLRSIVQNLGVPWPSVEKDWRILKNGVEGKTASLSTANVKQEVARILESVVEADFPKAQKREIEAVLKRPSSWENAKAGGRAFVPPGDASKACESLLQRLRAAGLFVVEVGEMEGFVRSEGGHGRDWVNAVLARPLATDPGLEAARNFVWDFVTSTVASINRRVTPRHLANPSPLTPSVT